MATKWNGLLSTVDAARLLGLSADMVRLLARSGKLPVAAASTRGVRMFNRADVLALAARRAGHPVHRHDVKFYEDSDELRRYLVALVDDAVARRAPVVLIARKPHLAWFRRHRAKLMLLDAEQTLDALCVNGMPNAKKFEEVVGSVLDATAAANRREAVCAYGEMVDLLWRRGDREATLALERIWNRASRTRTFHLSCGYSLDGFIGSGVEPICDVHTHVLPSELLAATPREIAVLQQRAVELETVRAKNRELASEVARLRALEARRTR